jgi:DnaK suppressor protein
MSSRTDRSKARTRKSPVIPPRIAAKTKMNGSKPPTKSKAASKAVEPSRQKARTAAATKVPAGVLKKTVQGSRKSDAASALFGRASAGTMTFSKSVHIEASGTKPTKNKSPSHLAAGKSTLGPSNAVVPSGYRPTDSEPFMNERQRTYFRNKLLAWKDDILRQNQETLQGLHEDTSQFADVADRATSETDRALELRARDRQRKLMAKIDAALARIEEGTYGYCEETGEPISLKRLDARPIATMSLEAQERKERMERVFRED